MAETVYLTDGTKLVGTIKKSDAEAIELETPDGTLVIKRERIILMDSQTKPPAAAPAPETPKPVPAAAPDATPRRSGKIVLTLDFFGAGNSSKALESDFQLGAVAAAGAGYSVNGALKTTGAVGARAAYLVPINPQVDLGASLGLIGGPNSEGSLRVAAGALTGVLTLERKLSFLRFLFEERTKFPITDRLAFNVGGGIGIASGNVEQELLCVGTACTTSGSRTTSKASWTGFSWELTPEMTYRRLLLALRIAGMPSFKGNDSLSKIEWTTAGFSIGFFF